MRKLERRAVLCLLLALILAAGTCLYVFRYVRDGSQWASFYANTHVYKNGHLAVGSIYDRNHVLLAANGAGEDGNTKYSSSRTTRLATAHAVGDMGGNVSTSAESVFRSKLIGYNLLTGTYSVTGKGTNLRLSIDEKVCRAAYEALAGRDGTVGVMNYKTGEIICMVSSPTFDPQTPPAAADAKNGTYLNKLISGKFTPGSTFKLVTAAAAIEKHPDWLKDFHYTCNGTHVVNGQTIRCSYAHGTVDFQGALTKSCNGAFAEIAQKVGAKTLKEYSGKLGLTSSYDMDGVKSAKGSFSFDTDAVSTSWTGIGQWKDQVNPLSYMVWLSAIARDGRGVQPQILHSALNGQRTDRMIEEDTAQKLSRMMRKNVKYGYHDSNYPGLELAAKSGTAEVSGHRPTAWFVGFSRDEDLPYCFVVCVEDGGVGSQVAGPVANRVMQQVKESVKK